LNNVASPLDPPAQPEGRIPAAPGQDLTELMESMKGTDQVLAPARASAFPEFDIPFCREEAYSLESKINSLAFLSE